jgi:hypothetical protein
MALISAGSHLEAWFCCGNPGTTILLATPRRLKSTAAVNSIVLPFEASDWRCQVIVSRSEKPDAGGHDHTAATAFRHSLAASARKIRSVDRETRWR